MDDEDGDGVLPSLTEPPVPRGARSPGERASLRPLSPPGIRLFTSPRTTTGSCVRTHLRGRVAYLQVTRSAARESPTDERVSP